METQTELSPTTTVYLFSEQFAEPAKGLLTQGAVAPRTGEKVNVKPLVISLYLAALMELLESGAARLETVETRKLFGKEQITTLAINGAPAGAPLSALAARIAQAAQSAQKPEQRRLREVIIRVVGGRGSTNYPWYVAMQPVIAQAAQQGLVLLPEKKPNLLKAAFQPAESYTAARAATERLEGRQGEGEAVRARLAAFEQKLGPTAATLRKEIQSGVDECMDRSSD